MLLECIPNFHKIQTQEKLMIRVRPRFFNQVGHEIIRMNAFSGNKHFFNISCHHQTYQNYEQSPKTSQYSYF